MEEGGQGGARPGNDAVWPLRPFAEYLLEKGLITGEKLAKVIRFRSELDTRLGQLSAMKGYLSP